jgi:hypothetical protein
MAGPPGRELSRCDSLWAGCWFCDEEEEEEEKEEGERNLRSHSKTPPCVSA